MSEVSAQLNNQGVEDLDEPKYVKKGGPGPAPVILGANAEDFEQVPIDLTQLVAAKKQLGDAEKLAQDAAQAGITVVKIIAQAADLGVKAEQAEKQVRVLLREILATHNVKVDEFRGFDFDRGIIKIQRGPSNDPSAS